MKKRKVGNMKMKQVSGQELMYADDMILIADSKKTIEQS